LFGSRAGAGRELLALESSVVVEYRTENNALFHKYDLPKKIGGISHYLKYFGTSYFEKSIF
jgi:hypothetical protein